MELETLVREVLREHAADAPSADHLLAAASGGNRRKRWIVAGLSAAAVVALAVSLAALRGATPHRTAPTTTTSVPPVSTPAGFTRIAYRRFTVAVPDGLPVLTSSCVAPARYVLAEDPNAEDSCVAGGVDAEHQTLTVRLTSAERAAAEIATRPAEIGGLPARVGYGRIDGYPGVAGQAVFAADDVAVVVTAPDRSTVEQILTSVRSGPDPNGCPPDVAAPADPAADELVPGTASSAVRCVYAATGSGKLLLQASLPVHAVALDALVRAIDALPGAGTPDRLQPFETDLLRFSYADATVRTILVELGDPTRYSDGHTDGYDDNNVVTDRLRSATS